MLESVVRELMIGSTVYASAHGKDNQLVDPWWRGKFHSLTGLPNQVVLVDFTGCPEAKTVTVEAVHLEHLHLHPQPAPAAEPEPEPASSVKD